MLILFELANNHSGNVETALKMVDEFAKVAKEFPQFQYAFKTQYRDLANFIHPDSNPDNKYVRRFRDTNLPFVERKRIVDAIKEREILAACTPFDEPSVDLAIAHGYDILKVGSPSITDWPLWNYILEHWHRPIIASVGGASDADIQRVVRQCDEHLIDLTLLHCVSEYPTKPDVLNLAQIWWLKEEFDVPVGYSSHEEPGGIGTMFAPLLGAEVIERHICLDPAPNKYSVTPDQMRLELSCIATAMKALGERNVRVPGEKPVQFMRRMVDGQMWWLPESVYPMEEIRDLMRKANLILPIGSVEEIYHHLGPDNFRDVGAFIVTCFNRDYCKKYIVLLPGQTLPSHRHKVKEETFTLLYGDANDLQVGQTLLVEPGISHSLKSRGGAVLEEISTKYLPNDSEYLDEAIQSNPNRKTTI